MSKLVKGAVKRAKKGLRFVKRYWKQIVIAAAVVFTAGLATVGAAGFSAAAASAGGGFAGFVSAAGSTMAAGVASIGGTIGIGQGANLAAFGGSGYATLGTGAAAQGLGLAGSNAAMTAGRIASTAPSAALGGGPPAALAGAAGTPVAQTAGQTVVGAGASQAAQQGGAMVAGQAAPAQGGILSRAMQSPWTGTLIQAGQGLISGYMQRRQEEEEWDRVKPRGFWGVGLNDTPSVEGPLPSLQGTAWNAASFQRPTMPTPPQQQFIAGQAPAREEVDIEPEYASTYGRI